jgi:murein DD-endopeptidase MepM/ murein hydrolase activator NlpD
MVKSRPIDHGSGLLGRYFRTERMEVRIGDLVVRDRRVGTVGSTGRSTDPHLHFEVRCNGVPHHPARFLPASD